MDPTATSDETQYITDNTQNMGSSNMLFTEKKHPERSHVAHIRMNGTTKNIKNRVKNSMICFITYCN
jgi:hypothetical protein